jgi:hypothetical protein
LGVFTVHIERCFSVLTHISTVQPKSEKPSKLDLFLLPALRRIAEMGEWAREEFPDSNIGWVLMPL